MSTDYVARLARVDLDRGTCRVVEVEAAELRRHIGGMDLAELGYPRGLNRLGWEHKADLTRKIQDVVCIINSLVVCQFSYHIYGVRLHSYLELLNAVTGWDMDFDEFLRAGERIFNLKRLINLRQGLRGQDDTLPPRVLQKLPDLSNDEQQVPTDLPGLLQQYYAGRGWEADGVPTPAKLEELGLPQNRMAGEMGLSDPRAIPAEA